MEISSMMRCRQLVQCCSTPGLWANSIHCSSGAEPEPIPVRAGHRRWERDRWSEETEMNNIYANTQFIPSTVYWDLITNVLKWKDTWHPLLNYIKDSGPEIRHHKDIATESKAAAVIERQMTLVKAAMFKIKTNLLTILLIVSIFFKV